jgi:putative ABC transport system permease protein
MFKYLPLLWANLGRKRLRTSLTIASIVVAFLLFGLMQTLRVALTGSPDLAGVDRLMTLHKISIVQSFPLSYLNRIRAVDGVKAATTSNWFGGIYQDERNQIGTFGVDVPSFLEVYDDYTLRPEERDAWLKDRTGAIVGKLLAERFNWKVGDTIPMRSNIWTQKDGGGNVWPMKIVGIFDATNGDNQSIYFHYDYLNESRAQIKDEIGMVVIKVADPARSEQIARAVDALFANSSYETKTATEKAFVQGFANQMGNIGKLLTMVAAAVFFTMLLVTANTMAQSIRERINEIGVLKTLGFSGGGVTMMIIGEAILVTALGGYIGLALAALVGEGMGKALAQFFPVLGMPSWTWAAGTALILILGGIAAALPCAQASRLKIVDALRKS